MAKILIIDPPGGWRYGFPKPAPTAIDTIYSDFELNKWLVDNGYPQAEIDKFHGRVPYRYWEIDEQETV